MAKEIPEIDELLQGINDADAAMETGRGQETEYRPEAETPPDTEKCWESFMACLESPVGHTGEARLVCKIDRDLADSLDDCAQPSKKRKDGVLCPVAEQKFQISLYDFHPCQTKFFVFLPICIDFNCTQC